MENTNRDKSATAQKLSLQFVAKFENKHELMSFFLNLDVADPYQSKVIGRIVSEVEKGIFRNSEILNLVEDEGSVLHFKKSWDFYHFLLGHFNKENKETSLKIESTFSSDELSYLKQDHHSDDSLHDTGYMMIHALNSIFSKPEIMELAKLFQQHRP